MSQIFFSKHILQSSTPTHNVIKQLPCKIGKLNAFIFQTKELPKEKVEYEIDEPQAAHKRQKHLHTFSSATVTYSHDPAVIIRQGLQKWTQSDTEMLGNLHLLSTQYRRSTVDRSPRTFWCSQMGFCDKGIVQSRQLMRLPDQMSSYSLRFSKGPFKVQKGKIPSGDQGLVTLPRGMMAL